MSSTAVRLAGRTTAFQRLAPLSLSTLFALFAGCSAGSSSGTVDGLSVAGQVTVVTVGGSGGGSVVSGSSADTSGFSASCDYFTDTSNAHVYDASLEAVTQVNFILCLMAQTSYADLVNFGPYLALVNESKCKNGSDNSSTGSDEGESSGANAGAPNLWTVESSRSSNGADEIVRIWLPSEGDHGVEQSIQVKITISEGASAENPFGVFDLNFAGYGPGGSIDSPDMFGNLHTLDVASGFLGFSFYQQQGDPNVAQQPDHHAEIIQANVNMFADQTQGVAYIRRTYRENYSGDSGTQVEEYKLAFDLAEVLRQKDSDPSVCLSRTTFDTRTWRYNLYYADGLDAGGRVELNSGFGFRTAGGEFGWMGYYGMWVPNGVTVANGDTVTRESFGGGTPTSYTVVKAPGKLIRNTRQTLALDQIVGLNFSWYHDDDPMDNQPGQQFRVQYTGTLWQEVASWNQGTNSWDDLGSPVTIDTAAVGFMGMYCESLGGPSTFLDGDTSITYYQREFVNGADSLFDSGSQIDLYGYFNCLDAGITGAEADIGDIFLPGSNDVNTPYHYVFSKSDLTLYLDVNGDGSVLTPAGLADGETISSGPNTWGMQSGSMVTSTGSLSSAWDTWNQDVFYTYETGPNSWNQYAALVDGAGDFVAFDPPIQFTYTHETANDANDDPTFDGQHFQFGYGGPGNLWGIPSEQVDTDGDGNPDRFYPQFSLLDGVLVGPTGTEYVVRAIDSELTLALDPGNCGALDLGGAGILTLPTSADYTMPDNGTQPTVTDPPAVIEGTVQTGG